MRHYIVVKLVQNENALRALSDSYYNSMMVMVLKVYI